MQFRHKIILMTLLLFSLLLSTVYVVQFNHTRAYLAKQMSVDVSNTLNSLGLSLIPHLKNEETVAAETTINAVFDGGSYQQIELRLLADDSTLSRRQPDTIVGVPDWFSRLGLFEMIQASNTLTSGWLQLAELTVVADTAYAYEQLWKLSSQILLWFSATAIIVVVLLFYFIRRLFEPLMAIEASANRIAEQHFGQPLPDPELKELKSLVSSFNAMSNRLQKLHQLQAQETEELRQAAYQDNLTQLGNRAFFEAELDQWMAEPSEGALVFVRLYRLKQLSEQQGYTVRDQLVVGVSGLLKTLQHSQMNSVVARISDHEFSIILSGLDTDQVRQVVTNLDQQLEQLLTRPTTEKLGRLYAIGGAIRTEALDAGALLARTDSALQEVRLDNTSAFKLVTSEREQPALGRNRWRELVLEAIDSNAIYFQLQPVMALDGTPIAEELFSLIEQQSHRYPAAQFMPFVEQYRLGAAFDRHVIEQVAPHVGGRQVPVVINLSESAIGDIGFINWLELLFEQSPALVQRLQFELPESALASQRAGLEMLCTVLRRLNVRFGFDRISQHLEKLEGLADFGPSYLKVDRSLVLNSQSGNNGFIRALARLAHEVDISLVVLRVEDPQQLQQLSQQLVDGYQGYISKPVSWSPGG